MSVLAQRGVKPGRGGVVLQHLSEVLLNLSASKPPSYRITEVSNTHSSLTLPLSVWLCGQTVRKPVVPCHFSCMTLTHRPTHSPHLHYSKQTPCVCVCACMLCVCVCVCVCVCACAEYSKIHYLHMHLALFRGNASYCTVFLSSSGRDHNS